MKCMQIDVLNSLHCIRKFDAKKKNYTSILENHNKLFNIILKIDIITKKLISLKHH